MPGVVGLRVLFIGPTGFMLSKSGDMSVKALKHEVLYNQLVSSVIFNVLDPSVHVEGEQWIRMEGRLLGVVILTDSRPLIGQMVRVCEELRGISVVFEHGKRGLSKKRALPR